jgi:hypothetical protein
MPSVVGTTNYPTALDDADSLIRAVNVASSTIDTGGVTNVATTVPVVSATAAAASGVAWCGTEAISYTGKTATTLIGCVRGFDGTTAAGHAAGDPIYFDPEIAARFTVLQNAIIAIETLIGAAARPVSGPASATDNAITLFNGTTGKLVKNSSVTVTDTTVSGLAASLFSTANPIMLFKETGGTYGAVQMMLSNEPSSNGVTFEQLSAGAAAGLIDFIFKPGSTGAPQRNIRVENRSGSVFVAAPEFEFGTAGDPVLILTDDTVISRGNMQVWNAADKTKKLVLDTSLLTTGTTRTVKFPDVNDTLLTRGIVAGSATAGTWPKTASGTVLTTPEAGAIEYDGATYYLTAEATPGRPAVNAQQIYRTTSASGTIGSAIADFFPATSSISLAASAIYEIVFHCYFTKTTAGTVVWTILASSAPTAMNVGTTIGGATGGAGVATAATTVATVASPSLTTAVNHYAEVRSIVETNAATNVRLRVTSSVGTVTQLRGSYYTVRRLPAGNTGAFVA